MNDYLEMTDEHMFTAIFHDYPAQKLKNMKLRGGRFKKIYNKSTMFKGVVLEGEDEYAPVSRNEGSYYVRRTRDNSLYRVDVPNRCLGWIMVLEDSKIHFVCPKDNKDD